MSCVEHEVPADGNVFLALGFEPELAARLLEATDREIEAKQMIEDQLLNELTSWVESRKHDPDTPVNIFGNKPSDIDRVLKARLGFLWQHSFKPGYLLFLSLDAPLQSGDL